MSTIVSPLRYPGGKSGLSGFMKLVVVGNDLMEGEYVEAYCGGAGVAMELLLSEYVQRVHLNDVDPAIYAFWWAVKNSPDELCRKISVTRLTVANWRRQRGILAAADDNDLLSLGFATFYLNRVNRSGILSAGPIGGLKQTGVWKMDARFNRQNLISQIEIIAKYGDRISVYREDALRFITRMSKELGNRALLYLDPPYVVKGQRLYLNAYNQDDHVAIAEAVQKIKRMPWIVSYDNDALIRRLYKGRRSMTYQIGYSANVRSSGREIMVFSDSLRTPSAKSPAGIHRDMVRKLLARAA